MNPTGFTDDILSTKPPKLYDRKKVAHFAARIEADTALNAAENAQAFSRDVEAQHFAYFEGSDDRMCHVSTFLVTAGKVFVCYYASTNNALEDPRFQTARLAWCSLEAPQEKTLLDIHAAGDTLWGEPVIGVYDTILMQKPSDPDHLYILWTANIGGRYYRLYRTFHIKTGTLGEIGVNRFQAGSVTNDFSFSGMQNALAENGIGYKAFFADIGIMQKQSWREENGLLYCYTGAYSGNFTCIIKSQDLITWEYVAQPNEGAQDTGFENETKWENAVYVLEDKVYYFVRQWDPVWDGNGALTQGSPYGILTRYDLTTGCWDTPVLVGDCQSRSDFFFYKGELYLFHAPTDRTHIGILKINRHDLSLSTVVLQAQMQGSCFYPFVQYFQGRTLGLSYTVDRKHIRLATFDLQKYLK